MVRRILMGKEFRQRTTPVRTFLFQFKQSWFKKHYWNGYLAEWHYPPANVMIYTCGHGWTKRRALRRFGHYLVQANLSWQEEVENGRDEVL